ncbi:hypothetical protein EST38_g13273 [Candolleomyces aberdarensis]|uniref:Uncharacterized protein n=1 Tax=Candolleomyces aberdarensis TaxID=2316362 RepID=A0A4Q2D2M1_9AGAR|nr:hypothetical protein EST38_g13273 [Candolleomyces aberdarensis]
MPRNDQGPVENIGPNGCPVVFHYSEWSSSTDFEAAAQREDALDGMDPDLEALDVTVKGVEDPATSTIPCDSRPKQLSPDIAGDPVESFPTEGRLVANTVSTKGAAPRPPPSTRKQIGRKRRRATARQEIGIKKKADVLGPAQSFSHKRSTLKKYGDKFDTIFSAMSADKLPHSSGGSWIGKSTQADPSTDLGLLSAEELVQNHGYTLVKYTPK